jgi:hypothetical protein
MRKQAPRAQPVRDQQRVKYPSSLEAKQAQRVAERSLANEFSGESSKPFYDLWTSGQDLILCIDTAATKRGIAAISRGWPK